MVIDDLKNAELYAGLGEDLNTALHFLRQTDFSGMGPGRIEIDGDRIFALVQQYTTETPVACSFEAHRRYIDVQYVAAGRERMLYANAGDLAEEKPYDQEGDYTLLAGDGSSLICREGMFAAFFPEDAHAPGLMAAGPEPVKKVVVKVAL